MTIVIPLWVVWAIIGMIAALGLMVLGAILFSWWQLRALFSR